MGMKLNAETVARLLGISVRTLHRWRQLDSSFPIPVKKGTELLFDEEEIGRWKDEHGPDVQIYEKEEDENERSARANPQWTDEMGILKDILRESLGLPADCKDSVLVGRTLQFLDEDAKLRRLLRELMPLVDDKVRPGESDDSQKAEGDKQ
jgi:predicted DNA-binding transcriptional regulator AlpA